MKTEIQTAKTEDLDFYPDIPFSPIFIIGEHRSGTTLLYKILTASEKFNYITAYDVIFYDNLLTNFKLGIDIQERENLNLSLVKNGMTNRGIDNVIVNADLPEEYGFILDNNSESKKITDKNLSIFFDICKKIQIITPRKKYILLKNPEDFCNINFIIKNIPNSRFIVINRNLKDIAKSRRKAYYHLLDKYNFYTSLLSKEYDRYFNNWLLRSIFKAYFSRYNFIGRIKNYNYVKKNKEKFLEEIHKVDKTRYINTSYESICMDPNFEISRIFDFLNIESENLNDLSAMIKRR